MRISRYWRTFEKTSCTVTCVAVRLVTQSRAIVIAKYLCKDLSTRRIKATSKRVSELQILLQSKGNWVSNLLLKLILFYLSACKVENRIGLVAPQHVYEGNNSPEGVSSLVIHVTFDYTDYKLNHTLEDREHAILLKREKVASALEFAPNRLVVATEFSLLLFHAGECVRVYDEWDQD